MFEGIDWSNMVVDGGAAVLALLPVPAEFQDNLEKYYSEIEQNFNSSDIDIHVSPV